MPLPPDKTELDIWAAIYAVLDDPKRAAIRQTLNEEIDALRVSIESEANEGVPDMEKIADYEQKIIFIEAKLNFLERGSGAALDALEIFPAYSINRAPSSLCGNIGGRPALT